MLEFPLVGITVVLTEAGREIATTVVALAKATGKDVYIGGVLCATVTRARTYADTQ